MKLGYITIMVRDLEKSLEFYQDIIGLRPERKLEMPQGHIVFLKNEDGETMLELIEFKDSLKVSTEGITLSFFSEQEKLQLIREKAITNGFASSEIISNGKKPAHFCLWDPDNIEIEITS